MNTYFLYRIALENTHLRPNSSICQAMTKYTMVTNVMQIGKHRSCGIPIRHTYTLKEKYLEVVN